MNVKLMCRVEKNAFTPERVAPAENARVRAVSTSAVPIP